MSKTDPELAQRIMAQHGLLTLRYENSGLSSPLDFGVDNKFLAIQDMVNQLKSIDPKLKHVNERIQMAEMKLKGNLSSEQLTTE